jgi:hypothetical protein
VQIQIDPALCAAFLYLHPERTVLNLNSARTEVAVNPAASHEFPDRVAQFTDADHLGVGIH